MTYYIEVILSTRDVQPWEDAKQDVTIGGGRSSVEDFARTHIFERRDHLRHEIRICSPQPKAIPKD